MEGLVFLGGNRVSEGVAQDWVRCGLRRDARAFGAIGGRRPHNCWTWDVKDITWNVMVVLFFLKSGDVSVKIGFMHVKITKWSSVTNRGWDWS